jgi:hypothetical protein
MKWIAFVFCFILIFCCEYNSNAQARNDYHWILGYGPNRPDEKLGGIHIDFNSDFPYPFYFETKCHAYEPAVLSSNNGRLLAYSNGCSIFN